jgi:hypothetical protein
MAIAARYQYLLRGRYWIAALPHDQSATPSRLRLMQVFFGSFVPIQQIAGQEG